MHRIDRIDRKPPPLILRIVCRDGRCNVGLALGVRSMDDRHMSSTTHAETVETLYRRYAALIWGLSYRMTGCAADADDVVQETFARAAENAAAVSPDAWRAWLLRVATNLSLDLLRRRKRRPYGTTWLPSPIETGAVETPANDNTGQSAEARYERAESLSYAFLLALEALTPRQRAVLLLRDVFDYAAQQTAAALEMSEENVRITHLRARRAMRDYDRSRCRPTEELQEQTRKAMEQFVRCMLTQDVDGATRLLTASVRTLTDGGEYTALPGPMTGRLRVLTLHMRVARRRAPGAHLDWRMINGLPALVIEYATTERRQAPRAVLRCEIDADGRIRELHSILASRKLSAIRF